MARVGHRLVPTYPPVVQLSWVQYLNSHPSEHGVGGFDTTSVTLAEVKQYVPLASLVERLLSAELASAKLVAGRLHREVLWGLLHLSEYQICPPRMKRDRRKA